MQLDEIYLGKQVYFYPAGYDLNFLNSSEKYSGFLNNSGSLCKIIAIDKEDKTWQIKLEFSDDVVTKDGVNTINKLWVGLESIKLVKVNAEII